MEATAVYLAYQDWLRIGVCAEPHMVITYFHVALITGQYSVVNSIRFTAGP